MSMEDRIWKKEKFWELNERMMGWWMTRVVMVTLTRWDDHGTIVTQGDRSRRGWRSEWGSWIGPYSYQNLLKLDNFSLSYDEKNLVCFFMPRSTMIECLRQIRQSDAQTKSSAVARIADHTGVSVLEVQPRSMTLISCEKAYATFY